MNRLCVKCFLAGAMALLALLLSAASEPTHSRYLFVWAMEAQRPNASRQALMSGYVEAYRRSLGVGRDFMAVFDVAPDVRPFGKLVAMLPVGEAILAHHTNYALPPNGQLYANDWGGNSTYVFDLHDPLHPCLLRRFSSVAGYSYPHSFSYLSNGNTLATFQYSGDAFDGAPGGLVEFGADGLILPSAGVLAHGGREHRGRRPVRRVASGPSDNIRPSWSGDGRWIYFGSNRSGQWQTWKAPARGNMAVKVTNNRGTERDWIAAKLSSEGREKLTAAPRSVAAE